MPDPAALHWEERARRAWADAARYKELAEATEQSMYNERRQKHEALAKAQEWQQIALTTRRLVDSTEAVLVWAEGRIRALEAEAAKPVAPVVRLERPA